jgi:NADPH-dependent 2,4-dienoyl-CoA reductase/sulfur reductase-like enzyme/rhodanese-related sulfurtransferase
MVKRIVIVGGVAGGATAAAKARREDEHAEITIFERGPYVSFANCGMPYYLGGEIVDRDKLLLMTPESFQRKYRVDVHIGQEVVALDCKSKEITVIVANGNEARHSYDKLILSQGAAPMRPPIKGIDREHVFTLRDIPDMDRIDSFLNHRHPESAVIIGGGFIGLEMAEAFHFRGLSVTVVEQASHIMPSLDEDVATECTASAQRDRFLIRTGCQVLTIDPNSVVLDDHTRVPADIVLVSTGVKPEVTLAKIAGLKIGPTGAVAVNARMETSDPDVLAVGDAAEVNHRLTGQRTRIALAGPANRQGRIAGINATGGHAIYGGAIGTSIVRLFENAIGSSGLSTRAAEEIGYSVITSMTRDPSHAGYYPGAETVVSKMIIDQSTGRILGAQVFGRDGVDKRIDVYACAIYNGVTVEDLAQTDFAYSPPFGLANDPVNQASFTAGHILHGDVNVITNVEDVPPGSCLLDVRETSEIESFGTLNGSMHIPLGDLRDSIDSIPRDRPIVVFCQKGQRGYLATRILAGFGFADVINLGGGYLQARYNGWDAKKPVLQ